VVRLRYESDQTPKPEVDSSITVRRNLQLWSETSGNSTTKYIPVK